MHWIKIMLLFTLKAWVTGSCRKDGLYKRGLNCVAGSESKYIPIRIFFLNRSKFDIVFGYFRNSFHFYSGVSKISITFTQ